MKKLVLSGLATVAVAATVWAVAGQSIADCCSGLLACCGGACCGQ